MLKKSSPRARRNVLLAGAALVVATVRGTLQQYSWQSIGDFLGAWFIHYIFILFIVAISYAFINTKVDFFLPNKTQGDRITKEEATVYVSIVLLVAAVLIFVVAHWPQRDFN